jgi:hypothetical protein
MEWRRKQQEIRDLYNNADIMSEVKSRRLRWAGHVLRRSEESQLKKVSKNNPEGRRSRGRPKQMVGPGQARYAARWSHGRGQVNLERLCWCG